MPDRPRPPPLGLRRDVWPGASERREIWGNLGVGVGEGPLALGGLRASSCLRPERPPPPALVWGHRGSVPAIERDVFCTRLPFGPCRPEGLLGGD